MERCPFDDVVVQRQKKKDKQTKHREFKESHEEDILVSRSQIGGFTHPSSVFRKPHDPMEYKARNLHERLVDCGVSMTFSRLQESLLTKKDMNLNIKSFEDMSLNQDLDIHLAVTEDPAQPPTVHFKVTPHTYRNWGILNVPFLRNILVLPERTIHNFQYTDDDEPVPLNTTLQKRAIQKEGKIRPSFVRTQWLHPNGVRAKKYSGKEVRLTDIFIQTSSLLVSAQHIKTLWWRLLIEREPSHQVDSSKESLVTTSVRVALYILPVVPTLQPDEDVVRLPLPNTDSLSEEVSSKMKEMRNRKAEKEEIKRERKKKEKSRSKEDKKVSSPFVSQL